MIIVKKITAILIIVFGFNSQLLADHSTCLKAYNHFKKVQNKCSQQACVETYNSWMDDVIETYYAGEKVKKDSAIAGRVWHDVGAGCVWAFDHNEFW